MGFIRRAPKNIGELEDSLLKLHENRQHIKGVRMNESSSHLEVDLSFTANSFGGEAGKDFYLPIRRGKLREAMELANSLLRGDFAPSRTDAQALYDLIDPVGQ